MVCGWNESLEEVVLFVCCFYGPFQAVSRATIFRWIVECVRMTGVQALLVDRITTHDTRAISSSWALFQGVPWLSSSRRFFGCFRTLSSFVFTRMFFVGEASLGRSISKSSSFVVRRSK